MSNQRKAPQNQSPTAKGLWLAVKLLLGMDDAIGRLAWVKQMAQVLE
jgi:hypothetical protein